VTVDAAQRQPTDPVPSLEDISTRWPLLRDPVQFVMRYAPAIRKYLEAILHNASDADDVAQDFLLRGLQRGFVRTEDLRGRFRYYLKRAVRNAALTHLQRRQCPAAGLDTDDLPDPHEDESAAEEQWLAQWRACLLDRALQALDHHQRQVPGNLFHTVMRLVLEYPDEDAAALAVRASAVAGRPIRAEAFRKQLSRARRRFAELLQEEVRRTLQQPTPESVREELAELGLLADVQDFLPPP
jgi:RNA polymerase sigma-70 factor (ECF subfamily)